MTSHDWKFLVEMILIIFCIIMIVVATISHTLWAVIYFGVLLVWNLVCVRSLLNEKKELE